MNEITNMERGERLCYPLEAYQRKMHLLDEDWETVAGDFISDFMHWCDMYGVDVERVIASAKSIYQEEIEDGN